MLLRFHELVIIEALEATPNRFAIELPYMAASSEFFL